MLESPDAFLIVEKGKPYGIGEALPLLRGKVLLGRTSQEHESVFSFLSPYVSRRHAAIEYMDGVYVLTDLPGSRHGTWINNERLAPSVPRRLEDRDRISLANAEVVLIFATSVSMAGETWDLPASSSKPSPKPILELDHDRREVMLDGKVLVPPLSGRPYELLQVLYDNRGRAVSDGEIKRTVWSDYGVGVDGKPMVSDVQLTTLVYQLRDRLKPHGTLIRTVPRFGYMLDLPG